MSLLSLLHGDPNSDTVIPEPPIIPDPPYIPRDFSEFATELLHHLPPSMWEDTDIDGFIVACARELDRIRQVVDEIQNIAFPLLAEDYLKFWEFTLNLTVEPSGLTLNQRRTRILGLLRNLNSNSSRTSWEEAVTAYLGNDWSYTVNDPTDYVIHISIPYEEGGTQANAAERFLAVITPAHLSINVVYGNSFLLGISELGDTL